MQNEKSSRNFKKKEPSLSTKLRYMFCVALIGLSACAPIKASPEHSSPTSTINTIELTYYNPTNDLIEVGQTSQLKMNTAFSLPLKIDDTTHPCEVEQSNIIEPSLDSGMLLIDERAHVCNNITTLSNLFGWNLSPNQIENLAKKIIVLSESDIKRLCMNIASGCHLPLADKIVLSQLAYDVSTIHEVVHGMYVENNSSYFSNQTENCYIKKSDSFEIVYSDDESVTGFSTAYLNKEFLPIFYEQLTISLGGGRNLVTGDRTILPSYLFVNNEETEEILIKILDELGKIGMIFAQSQSQLDTNFVPEQRATVEDHFGLLEFLTTEAGVNLLSLIDDTGQYLGTAFPDRFYYKAPTPSFVSPETVCDFKK